MTYWLAELMNDNDLLTEDWLNYLMTNWLSEWRNEWTGWLGDRKIDWLIE
jgi:hypothetical protein